MVPTTVISATPSFGLDVRERYSEPIPGGETHICEHCHSKFEKKRRWAKFCTARCRRAHHRQAEMIALFYAT